MAAFQKQESLNQVQEELLFKHLNNPHHFFIVSLTNVFKSCIFYIKCFYSSVFVFSE